MKTLRNLLLGLAALAALLILLTQCLPDHWKVSRSTLIKASGEAMLPLVDQYPGAWEQWSTLDSESRGASFAYSGTGAGAGEVRTWNSPVWGSIRQELLSVDPKTGVSFSLDLLERQMTVAGRLDFEARGNSTQVTLTCEGSLGRDPRRRLLGLLMESLVGPSVEASLGNLKTIVEKEALAKAVKAKATGKR